MNEDAAKWVLIALMATIFILLFWVIPSIISNYKRKLKDKNAASELETVKFEGLLREKDLIVKGLLHEKDLIIGKLQSDIEVQAKNLAEVQLAKWKEDELEAHRKVIIRAAIERAQSMLAEWKIQEGEKLRKDAVKRSMGVNFGKITEHLIPFSVHLQDFDPRDIRFIGSPVDLMIFDGATEKADVIDIYFVEIKTGSGQLSKKQKTIRDAIEGHRIHWKPIIVPEFKWDVPDEDNGEVSSPSS